jgi:single-stranded-DNA-specific exonuclease
MNKQWIVAEPYPAEFGKNFPHLSPVALQLLWNRGVRGEKEIDEFLTADFGRHVYDPFLFRDMKKAVERIFATIDKKENICVFGDFDADGVDAAIILCTTLRLYGVSPRVYIPHRETEGYGLNIGAIEYLAKEGDKLIITCDCGISNPAEINFAAEKGIDVIVTDHHAEPKVLPDKAVALIHPKLAGENYPCKNLSGGAVAFKVAQALLQTRPPLPAKETENFLKRLTELAAISLVADMVPLLGEARTLTKYGLIVLNKTTRLGLKKLIEVAGSAPGRIDARAIGFQIAPRINAAGRMDHANAAFALLDASDAESAVRLAIALNATNDERRKATDTLVAEAREEIVRTEQEDAPVIILYNEHWPIGLRGLAAGKIVEEYNRPAFVFSKKADDELVGSARSIPAVNVILAMQKMPDVFLRFGGHPGAAGMSIAPEKFEEFKSRFSAIVKEELKGKDLTPSISIDAELTIADLNWDIYGDIERFAPYGVGNPKPCFVARGLTVASAEAIGKDGKHLRLSVCGSKGERRKCIAFRFGELSAELQSGDKIDAVFELENNEWNGRNELQLNITDLTIVK